MIGAAALLFSAALEPAAADLAGQYRSQQIEIAAALELLPEGRFRYALEYGALSERGEGNWIYDGKAVRLTSEPMPRLPAFELVRDDPAPKDQLYITLDGPDPGWGGPLHAIVTLDGESEPALVVADEEGHVDLRGRRVATVQPLMPAFETAQEPLSLSADRGHRLLFRFHANDFGIAAFRGEPLVKSGDELLLNRYDTAIRFIRVRP